jgi:antagonist of KipI
MPVIRVLAGPEYSTFNTAAIKEFLGRRFTISPQSNRMGYRLNSPLDNYRTPVEVISSGVVPGTIQVTHSGQLIILLADAQTTGGYPRIANVISVDQDKLAQMRPGDSFSFRLISLKEAYEVF